MPTMRQNIPPYRFVGVLILVSLAIAFLFTIKESYGQIPKPKVNKPVYFVAAYDLRHSINTGAIQDEFARIGYEIWRTGDTLEVSHKAEEGFTPNFVLQFYELGIICFLMLGSPKRPGEMVSQISSFFLGGEAHEEFMSALISSGQLKSGDRKLIEEMDNWMFFCQAEGFWTLGRIWIRSDVKGKINIFLQNKPDYAWFNLNWLININGIEIDFPETEDLARFLHKGENHIEVPTYGAKIDRYCYFLISSKAGISSDFKNLQYKTFKADYIGEIWKQ